MIPIWVVDYSACGLKWHNSRIAPDFNGRKVRYLRRLKQLKLEAERNQSAVNAQRALASESLAENAIADNLNRLLLAKSHQTSSPNFSLKRNQAAKIVLENGVSEKFTKALEQMMRIQSNLKLADQRALAEMPQDQDLLPSLATPDAKESSSYSVLELEKTAWAQVTEEDKAREKLKREQKMAAWPEAKRQAYEQKQAAKEQKAKAKQERQNQKQAALEAKLTQKNAQKEAKRQEKLKAKGLQEAQPMNPHSASEAKAPPAPAAPPSESNPAKDKAQPQIDDPMIPVVRKAETVKAKNISEEE
ncbi:stress response protein nst1-like [Camponotus floridanus]|uniref:stress response protein nst1-like n=1 Tax=Camponotus floridanus TaxID=104421 RepID=UPI000DC6A7B4|nr:stress response protein nst1-like [Camponotus floridanus]